MVGFAELEEVIGFTVVVVAVVVVGTDVFVVLEFGLVLVAPP